MKDPHFAGIIYRIETCIHEFDWLFRDDPGEPRLKDSDAKSALRKAVSVLRGKSGSVPDNARDKVKTDLGGVLVALCQNLQEGSEATRGDFIKALLAVDDSLKTRREMAGHSRGYLDFLEGFLTLDGEKGWRKGVKRRI